MIFTIITLIAIPVGVFLLRKSEECEDDLKEGFLFGLGLLFTIGCGVAAVIMTAIIISAHVGVDADIEKNRITYDSLCQRYEIATSEYEDVSKSDVVRDIANWNKDVYGYKYWANNPWTSWFYSKRIADDLKMIEMEGSEK